MAGPGNVYAEGSVDRGPWFLYDRAIIIAVNTALATSYSFFSVPIGQSSKTKQDTNLEGRGNSLAPPNRLDVQSIGFAVRSNVLLSDLQTFLETYWFEFKIGNKVYAEGPLHAFPAGIGVNAGTTRTNEAAVNIGEPTLIATRRFPDFPRTIPPNVFFGVSVYTGGTGFTTATTAAGGQGLQIMCILDGIMDRSVQ